MNKAQDRIVKNKTLSKLLSNELMGSDNFNQAMTHRSANSKHNERMEFLGDSVLSLVISSHLYQTLPEASEGYLSRLRASLVNENALADIAIKLSLGEHIHLGSGELKSGGFRRKSILADAFEALIGCVYLEQGFDTAKAFILGVYQPSLEDLPSENELKDPKSRLQELLQSRNHPIPQYKLIEVTGEAHRQTFTAECNIHNLGICTQGADSSRRKAEQKAASYALQAVEAL